MRERGRVCGREREGECPGERERESVRVRECAERGRLCE